MTHSAPPAYLFLGYFRVMLALFVFIAHSEALDLYRDDVMWGGLGVWLFYVVSGYVILSAHESFYRGKVKAFLVNRALRIYPMVWACLGLGVVQIWLTDPGQLAQWGPRQIGLALSVIGGFADQNAWLPLPQAATLSVEALFYVASALVMVVAHAAGRWRGPVLYACGLGVLVAYGAVIATHSHYRFFGGLRWGPLFLLGAMVFYAQRSRFRAPQTVLLLLALAATVYQLLSLTSPSAQAPFAFDPVRVNTLALFLGLMALMVVLVHRAVPPLLHRADILAGDMTYPLYLVHVPVIALFDDYLGLGGGAGFGLQLAASLGLGYLLHRTVEVPFAALRRRWRGVAL